MIGLYEILWHRNGGDVAVRPAVITPQLLRFARIMVPQGDKFGIQKKSWVS